LEFLKLALESAGLEEALAIAERMEAFVTGAVHAAVSKATHEHTGADDMQPMGSTDATQDTAMRDADRAARSTDSRPRLLDGDNLRRFAEAAGSGMSNADLAARFGLTPRQANGLRMGLAKRGAIATKPKKSNHAVSLDRETELAMQEAFLKQREPSAVTMDDVVRFLRRRGDVVVRSGERFVVNSRLTLAPEELVGRANHMRSLLQEAPFPRDVWKVSPIRPAAEPDRGGEAHAARPVPAAPAR
jgi:hypothetical protein